MDSFRSRFFLLLAGLVLLFGALTLGLLLAGPGAARGVVLIVGAVALVLLMALAAWLGNSADAGARALRKVAYEDPLTGLPNRARAEDRIDELLQSSPSAPFALIVVEVRNVREINASLGHPVGDDALREVANQLRRNAAATDLVARLSANQFLIVAYRYSSRQAELWAQQLVAAMRAGLHLPSVNLDVRVMAGFCQYPDHGASSRQLMRRAQIALEDAATAPTRVAAYRPGHDEEQSRRLQIAADLRTAIEKGVLTLAFQPEMSLADRSVHQLEALVRWLHPQLGALSPAEFVPIAERTGSSRRLSGWALPAALKQMAQWQAAGLVLDVAVNLSAPDILDPPLVDEILEALESHGIDPHRLVLEITESAVMRDPQLAAHHMRILKTAGIRFAIDDFGTGHSSLAQLNRLPVDQLKIDRSFITHAHERPADARIVMSTIELAHDMGLEVIAEGVETREGLDLLRSLGCDLVQGALISVPLAPAAVEGFVRGAPRR